MSLPRKDRARVSRVQIINRRMNLNFFKRNKSESKKELPVCPVPATEGSHPFSFIKNYSQVSMCEYELYKNLREAVPIIDAAIDKTVRLMGNFEVVTGNSSIDSELALFLNTVSINGGNKGIYPFITSYVNELLTYGEAVGEIVLSRDKSEIAGLYNASLRDVTITAAGSPLNIMVCLNDGGLSPAKNQNLIIPTLLNPEPGTVRGTSILRGLPYVSGILLTIFDSIKKNWERVGDVRFSVTYKPDSSSPAVTKKQAQQIADEWSKAMRSSEVCDFVAIGDVNVKVIGADNQILDSTIPVRTLLEQIIAKLSLPPFVLGISWSSTERMSAQQADILTSELEFYRSLISPVIAKVAKLYLRLKGYDDSVEVKWDLINLQDEVELSKALLNKAHAREIERRTEVEYEDRTSY